MSEWIWLDGEVIPMSEARISPEDRGYQFADGVYEVMRLYKGRPFALDAHLDRLAQSCAGIEMTPPDRMLVTDAIEKILSRAGLTDGTVYLQATRGSSPRNHLIAESLREKGVFRGTLLCYARPTTPLPPPGEGRGVRLVSAVDERWKRCWVKSIALLPNILAKNRAADAGADEAVFIEEGKIITECAACNIFAVIGGRLVTHPVGPKVLPGITRAALLDLVRGGIDIQERPWLISEASKAEELFITSTTREIDWVRQWDGYFTAKRCGPITKSLAEALRNETSAV